MRPFEFVRRLIGNELERQLLHQERKAAPREQTRKPRAPEFARQSIGLLTVFAEKNVEQQ
jgi:hypothetical protein